MKKIKIVPWLDVSQLNKQLNDLLKRKHRIKVDIDSNGIDTTNKRVIHLNRTVSESTTVFGKLKAAILNTFSAPRVSMAAYLLVLRIINKAGQQMIQTTQELDKAGTDLQNSTNKSRESVQKLIQDYNEYGKELASTTTQITSAADDYLRAGKSMQETEVLIKDSIMLSKLGKIESAEATKNLLAVMNGYEQSIDEVGRSLDAMVAIDMKAATSAGDIATALKYSASSADLAGLSFNKLSAMIATVQDKTTGTAQTVGTFFNTVLARYRNVKVGQFLDDEGQDISKVETVLNSLGIKLRNTNHEFRDFEIVIDDVAKSWNNYSDVQQSMIAEALSGSRQQNKFIALMQGYNKTLELTEVAANSAGTALDKFNNSYMTSLEAKQNTLKNSFESMVMNSDMNEVYSGILQATTGLVEFINQTNALKGVMTSLVVAGGIKTFLLLRTGINEAYISLNKFQTAMTIAGKTRIPTKSFERLLLLSNGLSQSQMRLLLSSKNLTNARKVEILVNRGLSVEEAKLQLQTWGLSVAETGLTVSTISLGNALRGLWTTLMANPLILVTIAVSAGVMAFSKYKQAQEETRQAAADAASTYKDESASIEETTKKYQELRNELNEANTTEERQREIKQELLTLQKDLNEKYGDEYGHLNLVTDAYKDQTGAIKALNKELANKYLNENAEGIEQAAEVMEGKKLYSLFPDMPTSGEEGKILQELSKKYEDQGLKIFNRDGNKDLFTLQINADPKLAYKVISEFTNDVREKAQALEKEDLFKGFFKHSYKPLNTAKSDIDKNGVQYDQALEAQIINNDKLSTGYDKAIEAVEAYNQAVIDGDPDRIKQTRNDLKTVQDSIDLTSDEWKNYSGIMTDVFDQADTRVTDFTAALKNNKDGILNTAEALRGLSKEDLSSMADDGSDSNDVFDKFEKQAAAYNLTAEELIDTLIKLGIIQDKLATQPVPEYTKQDQIKAINDLSEGFEQIDKIFADVKDKDSFDFGNLADDKFIDTFSGMGDAYTDFIETVSSSPKDINACQSAFNNLVGTWLGSTDILKNVTEGTKDVTIAMLENMGISNADIIVQEALQQNIANLAAERYYAADSSFELANATSSEIQEFINEATQSGVTKNAIIQLVAQKIIANGTTLTTNGDIENLKSLAIQAGATQEAIAEMKTAGAGRLYGNNPDKAKQHLMDLISNSNVGTGTAVNYTGGAKSNKESKSKEKKEFSDELNSIDRLLELSKRRLQDYNNELEDALTVGDKYIAIDKIVSETENQLGKLLEVSQFYSKKTAEVLAQIPESMREQVQNGAVDIETLNDEKLSKLIKEFNDLDSSAQDTKEQMRELTNSIGDLKKQKIQIQIDDLERTKSKLERIQSQYESAISAVTSSIQLEIDGVNDYYDSQTKRIQDQIDALDEQNDKLEMQRKLEQSLYDLKRAETQRTTRVYREDKGFVYEADQEAIKDAKQSYDDVMFEKTKFDLQQILDSLEKERESEVDYLTDIKDTWEGISDSLERMADIKIADGMLGDGWLDDILSGDTDIFDNMLENFGNVFNGIFSSDQAIQSFNDLLSCIENGEMSVETATAQMEAGLTQLASTTTEQSAVMGNGYTSIYTAADNAKNLSAETYNVWTEYLNAFQEQTLEICNSLVNQFNAMADSVVAAAERAKEAAEDLKDMDSGGGSGRDKGVTTDKESIRSGGSSGVPGVHHKGILAGRVGENQSARDNQLATLKEAATRPLLDEERYVRALKGEMVLTEPQQTIMANNLNAFTGGIMPKLSIPNIDYSRFQTAKPESQKVEYNFNGGIQITEAQNVIDMAKGIKNGMFKSALYQELYKR